MCVAVTSKRIPRNNNSNSLQKKAKANSAQEREKGRAVGHRGASGRRCRRKGGNGLGRSRRIKNGFGKSAVYNCIGSLVVKSHPFAL
jgi:hypothetical protein